MRTLVVKIINTLFPHRGSKYDITINQSLEPMFEILMKLKDNEIIKLYDVVVHNHKG